MFMFLCFINREISTGLSSFGGICIKPINEIEILREKIQIVVLMEYFSIQMKRNKGL